MTALGGGREEGARKRVWMGSAVTVSHRVKGERGARGGADICSTSAGKNELHSIIFEGRPKGERGRQSEWISSEVDSERLSPNIESNYLNAPSGWPSRCSTSEAYSARLSPIAHPILEAPWPIPAAAPPLHLGG